MKLAFSISHLPLKKVGEVDWNFFSGFSRFVCFLGLEHYIFPLLYLGWSHLPDLGFDLMMEFDGSWPRVGNPPEWDWSEFKLDRRTPVICFMSLLGPTAEKKKCVGNQHSNQSTFLQQRLKNDWKWDFYLFEKHCYVPGSSLCVEKMGCRDCFPLGWMSHHCPAPFHLAVQKGAGGDGNWCRTDRAVHCRRSHASLSLVGGNETQS